MLMLEFSRRTQQAVDISIQIRCRALAKADSLSASVFKLWIVRGLRAQRLNRGLDP